jgi:hypothetical protein
MQRSLVTSIALVILAAAAVAAPSQAVEVIQIRSGQSGGVPGTCGQSDDTFHMLVGTCGTALSAAAFGPEFGLAQAGPFAKVIDPLTPIWVGGLQCDAKARWVSAAPVFCGFPQGGTDQSILYAHQFTVQTAGNPTCHLEVCWAVDDGLGDQWGPPYNPQGVYVNGTPVAISGGAYTPETVASQNVALQTGTNWIYFYQRDAGCAVAGLIVSATITCGGTVDTAPASWENVKTLYR